LYWAYWKCNSTRRINFVLSASVWYYFSTIVNEIIRLTLNMALEFKFMYLSIAIISTAFLIFVSRRLIWSRLTCIWMSTWMQNSVTFIYKYSIHCTFCIPLIMHLYRDHKSSNLQMTFNIYCTCKLIDILWKLLKTLMKIFQKCAYKCMKIKKAPIMNFSWAGLWEVRGELRK
jgi:hypothetical protein